MAPSPIRLDAAAGGAGGSWYVLLEGLAKLVREIHPWIELHVVEGGGVMNHVDVGTGRVPIAIPNPPMTAAALAQALREKRLAGAAIDVFAQEPPPAGHPFYALDNVIVSPHVSGFLPSYDDKCAALFAENLRRYLGGAPLLNLVDRATGY